MLLLGSVLSSFPVAPSITILLKGAVYLRGWVRLHRERLSGYPGWRASAFVVALSVMLLALSSPVDRLTEELLLMHMTQHILLMSLIPPLIALGSPTVPLLRGLPIWTVQIMVRPMLRSRVLRRTAKVLSTPVPSVFAMNLVFIAWHVPALYEVALHSEAWHAVEHLCFFSTALIFWWKIIDPLPSREPWSPWTKIACLVFADVANTGVSAYLSFCGHIIYPSYDHASPIWGLTAIADQSAAGAEMWVINSLAFLFPALVIPLRALAPSFTRRPAFRKQSYDLNGSTRAGSI